MDDNAVAAAGKMTEALETLERARGHLYSFHQLVGETDFKLDEVLELLRERGDDELADRLSRELVGRNVLPGLTFPRRARRRPPARPRALKERPRRCSEPGAALHAPAGDNRRHRPARIRFALAESDRGRRRVAGAVHDRHRWRSSPRRER